MSLAWQLSKAITGWTTIKAPDSLALSATWASATYNQVYYARHSILAGANTTIDFRSYTDPFGATVTATKLVAIEFQVTGTNAVLTVEPGASNPLTWFISGTAPVLTLTPSGTTAAAALFWRPTGFTVDATHRNLLLTNTGSGTATVLVAALLGDT